MSPEESFDHIASQFIKDGFAVLHNFLSEAEVEDLRRVSDPPLPVGLQAPNQRPVLSVNVAVCCVLQECDCLVEEAQATGTIDGPDWAAKQTGCIFEVLPRELDPRTATSRAGFLERRTQWPLKQRVCHLLFGPRMRALVHAVLGCHGFLFNDQARALLLALHIPVTSPPPPHTHTHRLCRNRVWTLCKVPKSTPQSKVRKCLSQYIVKPGRSRLSAFGWHRDSDWLPDGLQSPAYASVRK
jgi:hypothetical protein